MKYETEMYVGWARVELADIPLTPLRAADVHTQTTHICI